MTRRLRNLTPLRWCVVAVVLAAGLALPSLSGGAPATSDGLTAYFDAEEGSTPLDIFGVRFGQTASTDLTLIIRTHKPWETDAINPRFGRTLCLMLRSDEQPLPAGRLCAYPSESAKSGLALRYTVLDPQTGIQRGIRDLSPVVSRPSKTTIRTSFPPSLLRLKPGLYHWVARSQFRDDILCPPPAGCEDDLPNAGEANVQITLSISPEARQRCFGAASRDRSKPCRNPKLARAVVPTPDNAVITPNIPCTPLKQIGLVIPCEFGVPAPDARTNVALIGDSHAAHWRAALEIVAQTAKWRGISVTRSGCPYTRAVARLDPASRRQSCVRWNQEVPRWLAANPKISTVFVVAHFDSTIVVKNPANEFRAKMAGYTASVEGAAEVGQAGHRHPRHAEVHAGHAELRARRDGQAQERRPDVRAGAFQGARPRRGGIGRRAQPLQAGQAHRHDLVLLQHEELLPGRRRRARLQGHLAHHRRLRVVARAVPAAQGPLAQRLLSGTPARSGRPPPGACYSMFCWYVCTMRCVPRRHVTRASISVAIDSRRSVQLKPSTFVVQRPFGDLPFFVRHL